MKVLRKDFVPEGTVSYCNNRVLTSCKAYILEDIHKNRHYAGSTCVQKHIPNINLSDVADLTKALSYKIDEHSTYTDKVIHKSLEHKKQDTNLSNAISYLLLREDYLSNYEIIDKFKFNKLTQLYECYKRTSTLQKKEVEQVLFYEKQSNEINTRLSLKNLATCHAYEFILKKALVHLKNKTYIEGLLKDLIKYSKLTLPQIEGLDKWLNFIPEMNNSELRKFDE